ncbi:invasion associated locus B family protein [Alkalilacustris brevis]|uniref:invasion associated locus B family protein n=1 Tax=Alkalilacustris brevis TaxID=2026338 RepID=UPI000E0DD2B5|nr:invasion associated locus B family protein [Alkalilacustris brevis]
MTISTSWGVAQGDATEQFRDWALVCSEAGECRLAQTLMSSDRVWLGTVILQPLAQGEQARMADLFVPLGAHFPSGVFVGRGGGAMQRAEWVHCSEVACEARFQLDGEGERSWRAGQTAELRYRPSPSAPAASIDISLMGVTAGLQALDQLADDNG